MPTTHKELDGALECARSYAEQPIDKSRHAESLAAKHRNDQSAEEQLLDLRQRQQTEARKADNLRFAGEAKIQEFGTLVGKRWVEEHGPLSPDAAVLIAERGAGAIGVPHIWSAIFGVANTMAGRTISFGRSTVFIRSVAAAIGDGVQRLGLKAKQQPPPLRDPLIY